MKNIIRIEKRKKFTIISRSLLEDSRLGWSTRGILGYLLSKPDNWVLQVSDLRKNGDLGRDALYRRINEAIRYGYISRIYYRDSKGRRSGVEYTVREEPINPVTENQDTEKANPELPDLDNTDYSKYSLVTKTKKETTTTTTSSGKQLSYIFHQKITSFQKHQIKSLLKPLDVESAQDLLDELAGFIEKDLIKRDMVSLVDGLVRKAISGEFQLRLGLAVKQSRKRADEIQNQIVRSMATTPDISQTDLNSPLVQRIHALQKEVSDE